MANWNEFSTKRIVEVKQRVQTIVVYEDLGDTIEDPDPEPVMREAVVDSFDRPIQATYT